MKEKLKIRIGYKHDKYGNQLYDELGKPIPIYKTIKKLKVMYIDKDKQISFHNVKPFFNGQFWMYEVKKVSCVIPTPDEMIMWTPRVGETPIVVTRWSDWDELTRKTENDWLKP